jgi:hypothetical protein
VKEELLPSIQTQSCYPIPAVYLRFKEAVASTCFASLSSPRPSPAASRETFLGHSALAIGKLIDLKNIYMPISYKKCNLDCSWLQTGIYSKYLDL